MEITKRHTIDKQLLLFFSLIALMCIVISLIRLLVIDIEKPIHESDGYEFYSKLIKDWINGNGLTEKQVRWFLSYKHKNRFLYPLIVAIISTITFIPIFPAGVILGLLSYLASFLVLYKIYLKKYDTNDLIKSFILLISCSTIVTNLCRFATDGVQSFFIIVSVYFYYKSIEIKKRKNIILSLFFVFLAILTRESAIILLVIYIFTYIKKMKWKVITIIIGIGFTIGSAFFSIGNNTLLYIILRNIFLPETALELSQGIINLTTPFKELQKQFSLIYIFNMSKAIIFAFFLSGIFGISFLIKDHFVKKTRKFDLEFRWVFIYCFFLLFIYNGRILDRFFIPIIFFINIYVIEEIENVSNYFAENKDAANIKLSSLYRLFSNPNTIFLLNIVINIIINFARLVGAILT
ncbi:MAG: hypothetical protein ACTSQE_15560 [Candidatus Heimdallarchaeaceae archaeon]